MEPTRPEGRPHVPLTSEDPDLAEPYFEPVPTDSSSREEFYDLDEGSGEVSLSHVTRAGDAVRNVVGAGMRQGLSLTQRASVAWWRANGDREHRHTRGIYVKERAGRAPVLYVYIDSSALLQDFTTNKDLYLARLANRGFEVSDLRFRLSRSAGSPRPAPAPEPARPQPRPVEPLSPAEDARVDQMCSQLPDSLRQTVSDAMKLIVSRQKSDSTQKS